jgi:hypothetical protein
MTQRIIGRSGSRRRRRFLVIAPFVLLAALVLAIGASAGPVGNAAGFEDDDGNLVVNSTFDWNGFSPTTWTGAAPYRTSDKTVSGWKFKGIEDAAAVTSDTAFAGGVKQDDNCATVNTGKAPNKDDLKRIYLATKIVNNHTYLELAWVRIPQNTTSPSAHVAFEFNKSKTPCGGNSDGLVQRSVGDMLIVYDFEGGSTDVPQLTLRRWTTSGPCEVSSDSAPCWGVATNLTLGGFAEAKVNTFGTVVDTISPTSPASVTLGTSEFGEAGIDLTGAGVFTAGSCESFGKAFGVSRSSGNSGTAQMKDLVGPADFTLSNCGTVIIHKTTVPAGGTGFPFTSDVTSSPAVAANAAFSLDDGGTQTMTNVVAGSYTVTETVGSIGNYTLTGIDCTAGNVTPTSTSTTTGATAFTIGAGQTLECTYTNTRNKSNPGASTAPSAIPQDAATITSLDTTGSVDGAADQELHFQLWSAAGCTGTKLYEKTVTVTANTTYNTDNTGVGPSPGGYTITADETDYWAIVYDGDSRNTAFSTCNEAIGVDVTASP